MKINKINTKLKILQNKCCNFQCNNPQTKEPKLESAIRIIPEWFDFSSMWILNSIKSIVKFKDGI